MSQESSPNASDTASSEIIPGSRFVGAWVLGALAAASGYATTRYVLLGPVPWEQVPLYVANKVLALAGLVLLVAAQCYRASGIRRRLGCWGTGLVAAHLAASAVLLQPSYFPAWFTPEGKFTLAAGLALLSGVLAAVLLGRLWLVSASKSAEVSSRSGSLILGGGSLMLGLTAIHLLCMGGSGWLTPSRWHGSLPPITLLGFLLSVTALLLRARSTATRSQS